MNLDRKTIEYPGINSPSTPRELKVEIAGLRNAIKQAEELISRWEQVLLIVTEKEQEAQPDGGET